MHQRPDQAYLAARITRRDVLRRALRVSAAAALLPVALPLVACGRAEGEGPGLAYLGPATPEVEPPETPVPTATPRALGTAGRPRPAPVPPAQVALDPPQLGQGETAVLSVRQPGAAGGSVRLLGQRVPLIDEGEGALWCVVGAGLLQALGPASATVTTRDESGALLSEVDHPFEVVFVERPVDYLVASAEVVAVLTPEAAEIEAALRSYEQFNLFEARPRWNGRLIVPVEGGFQTTAFGEGRSVNGGPVTGQHSGVDIAHAEGTPILAAADARVAWAGAMPIRGNSVLLDHGAGVVTGYHHLLDWDVAVGQMVAEGDMIARMGSTGFSTGPHLHWEMTIYGVNVDPMTWTARPFLPEA